LSHERRCESKSRQARRAINLDELQDRRHLDEVVPAKAGPFIARVLAQIGSGRESLNAGNPSMPCSACNAPLSAKVSAQRPGIPSTPCEASDRSDTVTLTSEARTDSLLSDTPIALSHQQLRRMDFALPQRTR